MTKLIEVLGKMKDLPSLPSRTKDWPSFLQRTAYSKGRPERLKSLLEEIDLLPEEASMANLSEISLNSLLCCLVSHAEEAFVTSGGDEPNWDWFAKIVEDKAAEMLNENPTP